MEQTKQAGLGQACFLNSLSISSDKPMEQQGNDLNT